MMAEDLDLKTVVKHLANGSLGDSLCVVCLLPITEDSCENIFTAICKKNDEYCIADVLREVCQLKISDTEQYNVCCNCFQTASAAYKFYLQAKCSYNILHFYTDQISSNIKDLEITEEDSKRLLCIPLPVYTPEKPGFDYGFEGIGTRKMGDDIETEKENIIKEDEFIVIVRDGNTTKYRILNGELCKIEESDKESDDDNVLMIVNEKTRKKRDPMMSISCLHCPVKYRFVSKLKDHEKKVHNVDIYYCKICKLITERKNDFDEHLATHIGNYQCTECNAVYRKESSLIEHLKCHDKHEAQYLLENCNICEVCGVILEDESALDAHRALRHVKRYTCYYCGRMYKGQASFELHIEKHEKLLKKSNNKPTKQSTKSKPDHEAVVPESSSTRSICGVCGKSFVDERSLLWHQRLHNNDRPFVCDTCGRGFVSVNRRNQHATCAHSPPARRCPLCPALFHMRSMVNTHLKKVHLNKQNKRRNRITKHTNVFWRTETVPIQELSVSIQNQVLEIQSSQDNDWDDLTKKPLEKSTDHTETLHSTELYFIDINTDLPNDIMSENQEYQISRPDEFIMLPID